VHPVAATGLGVAGRAELGDLHAGIDDAVFDIAPLLEWADRDDREGEEAPPDVTE
jgi:hypothetical protein